MKDIIQQPKAAFLVLVVVIVIGIMVAVCWHAVEEIHYLNAMIY